MSEKAVYESALSSKIASYVAARRAEGNKFVTGAYLMRQLDRLACDMGWGQDVLGRELVEEYVSPRPGEREATRANRVSAVRCFGRHLAAGGDEGAYVLPAVGLSVGKYDFVPRLLTEKEVARLFAAADSMRPCGVSPLRHVVTPMLLRVTYCCGLRISEATGLLWRDVDLERGVLAVRGAKFNKDRRVPMSGSLLAACRDYASAMEPFGRRPESWFLPSPNGRYSSSAVGTTFRALLAAAGIPHYDDGPTLHSLRHSFACHRLAAWARDGTDVAAMMPYLSAYMGHEGLLGTERYLRLTGEMAPDLRGLVEATCSWVVPGVM